MFVISLAGVRIGIDNRYPFIERQCRAFLCEGEAEFVVSASPDDILEESKHGEFSDAYCESICLYRRICEKIADYNVFLMHSSIVEVDGFAYAFCAKSGVGKSTHTRLWIKNIPNARVLNGDKPLLKLEDDGSVTAYGTPWNGKENWGENISAPLRAVCFLERGAENSIRRLDTVESYYNLSSQIARPYYDTRPGDKLLDFTERLLDTVPIYCLTCNISTEAVETVVREIFPQEDI